MKAKLSAAVALETRKRLGQTLLGALGLEAENIRGAVVAD